MHFLFRLFIFRIRAEEKEFDVLLNATFRENCRTAEISEWVIAGVAAAVTESEGAAAETVEQSTVTVRSEVAANELAAVDKLFADVANRKKPTRKVPREGPTDVSVDDPLRVVIGGDGIGKGGNVVVIDGSDDGDHHKRRTNDRNLVEKSVEEDNNERDPQRGFIESDLKKISLSEDLEDSEERDPQRGFIESDLKKISLSEDLEDSKERDPQRGFIEPDLKKITLTEDLGWNGIDITPEEQVDVLKEFGDLNLLEGSGAVTGRIGEMYAWKFLSKWLGTEPHNARISWANVRAEAGKPFDFVISFPNGEEKLCEVKTRCSDLPVRQWAISVHEGVFSFKY